MEDPTPDSLQPERLTRPNVEALDAILGEAFPVLDQGFVRVIDYMGDDSAIVQAARVSYGKGTKKVMDDRGLIRYLLRQRHTSPFEMCEIKIHIRVPMDCWRQWIRHRTASVNEYSTRYSEAIDANQTTLADRWRSQSKDNKQGSGDFLSPAAGRVLTFQEKEFHEAARDVYQARLSAGVAREQARKDLPLSTYTEAYWKIDLHNLLHFLALRLHTHAQAEIRAFAKAIADVVSMWVPLAWEAFGDYVLDGFTLSGPEIRSIARIFGEFLAPENWQGLTSQLSKRELAELSDKLKAFGVL